MKTTIKWSFTLASLVTLLALLLWQSCERSNLERQLLSKKRIDTIYINKPYPVEKIKTIFLEKPVYVKVFQKDSSLRRQIERSDIITAIDIDPREIKIDRVDTSGIVFSSHYELPAFRKIKIDQQGNLQVKKKQRWGRKLLIAAAVACSALIILHNNHH